MSDNVILGVKNLGISATMLLFCVKSDRSVLKETLIMSH